MRDHFGGELASDDTLPPEKWPANSSFVVAVGDGALRKRMTERAESFGHVAVSLLSPRASYNGVLPPGCIVMPGAVLTCDITIGRGVLINMGALIGHDTILEDYCSIQPGVCMTGNTHVMAGAYVGINSTVINKFPIPNPMRIIGAGAIVGGGSVVTRDVSPAVTVVGSPANVIAQRAPRSCPLPCRSPHMDDPDLHLCARPDGHKGVCACEDICTRSGIEMARR